MALTTIVRTFKLNGDAWTVFITSCLYFNDIAYGNVTMKSDLLFNESVELLAKFSELISLPKQAGGISRVRLSKVDIPEEKC